MFSLNKNNFIRVDFIILILMMLYAPAALTVNGEIENEIQIRADYMKFNIKTGSSTYQGDVRITQGSIELTGDKVTIERQQDKIQQINIDGQPARYIQDGDSENKIHATSQHMQYFANDNRLVMTVDAHLEQPSHTIDSQRIVYDTKSKTVIAGDENNEEHEQSGRVNITLTPKKESDTTPANTPPVNENIEKQ